MSFSQAPFTLALIEMIIEKCCSTYRTLYAYKYTVSDLGPFPYILSVVISTENAHVKFQDETHLVCAVAVHQVVVLCRSL